MADLPEIKIPPVHEIVSALSGADAPHALVVSLARRAAAEVRERRIAPSAAADWVRLQIAALAAPSLRRVINATGVILHTNLGRAPLAGYLNLEYDLGEGRRGKRDTHVARLIEEILGAPAVVVNNNAAAVFLALQELARGGEVVVSRGELIEIGDGFRIPDIMAASGARLCEVGATNRTRIGDYAAAIGSGTRLIMIVHPSNFRMSGFTAKPARREIVALGRERGIPVYEDLGSGCLADLRPFGFDEPRVSEALGDGVDLVSFSGDKLLGGPQAGILAGRGELVQRLRRNPVFRALRLDKLALAALEETLRNVLFERWEAIPALRMIRLGEAEIKLRAERFAGLCGGEVIPGESLAGGGSTPEQPLPTWLVAVPGDAARMEARLREGEPPVIARIQKDRLVLDLRTVGPEEEEALARALEVAAVLG